MPITPGKSFFALLFIVLLASCSSAPVIPPTSTPTFSRFLPPAWTATVTNTPTSAAASTITSTAARTPAATMTQTLPPSLTPLPTISFDNAAGNFEVLLATNGGCRLPCFWGMAPGKTSVAEMNQFADRLPPDLVDIESHRYVIYYITRKTGDTSFAVNFLTDDNVLRSIHLGVDTARYYVTLPKLLNDYGMPTQVLIGPPMFEDWLSLLVLYEDQQFMGEYVLFPNKDDSSLYCFDPAFSPMDIVTWSPDQTWQNFIEQKEQSYQSLDEVSKYDILSFHETLRNDNRALCLEVQTDGIPK